MLTNKFKINYSIGSIANGIKTDTFTFFLLLAACASILKIKPISFYYNDINQSLEIAESKNIIEKKERKFYKNFFDKLFKNENVRKFFNPKNISFNEVEILNDKGNVYRLDRVVEMSDNFVYVIDYKTGEVRDSYIKQVENYKDLLSEIYSREIKGLLIYVDSNKTIEI